MASDRGYGYGPHILRPIERSEPDGGMDGIGEADCRKNGKDCKSVLSSICYDISLLLNQHTCCWRGRTDV